jgi:release factor glutamine methyltransferase
MKVSQVFSIARHELDRIGVKDADSEARFITSWVCGLPVGRIAVAHDVEIEGITERLEEVLSRRRKREPLQLILGKWDFFGREFLLEPGVLVPRQETEVLVDVALSSLGWFGERDLKGLEVGSGSGVVCVTLLSEMGNVHMVALDIAERAVAVTEKNARFHRVSDRLRVHRGDFRSIPDDLGKSFDFIISNPPYLSKREFMSAMPEVRDYEPEEALVGGETGLESIEEIVRISGDHLVPGGFLFFEFGFGQKVRVSEIVESDSRFEKCEIINDLARIPRITAVRRRRETSGQEG